MRKISELVFDFDGVLVDAKIFCIVRLGSTKSDLSLGFRLPVIKPRKVLLLVSSCSHECEFESGAQNKGGFVKNGFVPTIFKGDFIKSDCNIIT